MKKRRKTSSPEPQARSGAGSAWKNGALGLSLGTLIWILFGELTRGFLPYITSDAAFALFALAGAWMGARQRWLPLRLGAVLCATSAILIAYTPVMPWLIPSVTLSEQPDRAPALFVLSATVSRDGRLSEAAMARLLKACETLGQGYASRVILSHGGDGDSWVPIAKGTMRSLRLAQPVDEIGPVQDTHDEAVLAARLARQRGWDHLLVVSNAWHLRRARALFARQGLRVTCLAAQEATYNPFNPEPGWNRIRAFQDWSHEALGMLVYRLRGWI